MLLKMHFSQNDVIVCESVKCLHLFSTLGREWVTQGALRGPEVQIQLPRVSTFKCKFSFVCFILAFFMDLFSFIIDLFSFY